MKKSLKICLALLMVSQLSGCFLTKLITVPMRVTGAVISIVPGPGDIAHKAIDTAAESIDDLPI